MLGVPCDEFGGQEPGSDEEIHAFCTSRYNVTFPMTTKQIINGRGAHPLFTAMREEFTMDILPRWNFFKYLFGRDGEFIDWFSTQAKPLGPKIRPGIAAALSAQKSGS